MTSTEPTQATAGSATRRRPAVSRTWVLLALLWLFQAMTTAIWLRQDNRYPVADTAVNLVRAFRVADVLAHPSLDWITRIVAASDGQPPLYYVITAPLIWLFGPGADSATLVNLALLALLLVGAAGLAAGLLGRLFSADADEASTQRSLVSWIALAAAAFLSFLPAIFTYQRVYNPVFGLATVVALAMWLLVRSQGFASRRHALAFGLVAAAGVWMASTFWLYLLLPALIVGVLAVLTPRPPATSRRCAPVATAASGSFAGCDSRRLTSILRWRFCWRCWVSPSSWLRMFQPPSLSRRASPAPRCWTTRWAAFSCCCCWLACLWLLSS